MFCLKDLLLSENNLLMYGESKFCVSKLDLFKCRYEGIDIIVTVVAIAVDRNLVFC